MQVACENNIQVMNFHTRQTVNRVSKVLLKKRGLKLTKTYRLLLEKQK